MSDQLKLEEEALKKQAKDIKIAVADYKSFGRSPFQNEIVALDAMNTDFLAKFKTMLENLNDSNPKLIETLSDIEDMTREIVRTFEKIDKNGANSMGFHREG